MRFSIIILTSIKFLDSVQPYISLLNFLYHPSLRFRGTTYNWYLSSVKRYKQCKSLKNSITVNSTPSLEKKPSAAVSSGVKSTFYETTQSDTFYVYSLSHTHDQPRTWDDGRLCFHRLCLFKYRGWR